MPKIVTEEDRAKTRDEIYKHAVSLIRKKGLKKVTVDDITTASGISKGAFYAYYPSREIGLFEILNRSKAELLARMEAIMAKDLRGKQRISEFFRDVYLASDSIILHLSPADYEALLEKLPPEYQQQEEERIADYLERSLTLLEVDKEHMETIALLTDCIGMAATNTAYSKRAQEQSIDLIIDSIADYLDTPSSKNSKDLKS